MLRSFGVRSFTTRSPIRSSPSLISSSPATIRSAVVLPQPDGPTRTISSPSLISEIEVEDRLRPVVVDLLDVDELDLRHRRR